MGKQSTRTIILSLAILGMSLIPTLLIRRAMFERQREEIASFRFIRSVGSPNGKQFALEFEHTPKKALFTATDKIVVLDSRATISLSELWMRMKANRVALIVSGRTSQDVELIWQNDTELHLNCSNCMNASDEILRRAPRSGQTSIEYVGFPKDAPYTNVQPVEN